MRRAVAFAFAFAFAVTFAARAAFAQVIVPPRAHETKIVYPEGGHGDAVVVLEIVVSPEGRVVDWRVLAGGEPFLTAVKHAIESMAFDPATRDDKPITARMRIELPFHETKVEVEAPVIANVVEHVVVPPKPKPPPPITGVEDVHVQGTRKEIGGSAISKEDVRDLPGAFGDAFRAIDMMPGVTPIFSGVPFFFVRGAPPGNTGYFLDDVRVPLLFHLALGPSVVHPSLIERVDFYPGGFPAQYGRFAGGIVAGETREPSSKLGGEAEARLFDVGVLGETPFANGKGSALVAGRYGYPALLLPLFAPNNQLAYWDYQARIAYRVTPRDTISAFVFGSFDELDQRDPIGPPDADGKTRYGNFYPLLRTEFHRADLRWDHAVPGGNLRTALTLGIDHSIEGNPNSSTGVDAESIQLRTRLDRKLTSALRLRTGADVILYHYDYSRAFSFDPAISTTYPARNDVTFGAYADVVWKVDPRVEIVPGIRFDVFTSRADGTVSPGSPLSLVTGDRASAAPALDPRLAARVTVSKRLAWLGTLGLVHQPPSLGPIPGGELGSLSKGLQNAVQASQGFEAKLPWDLEFKSTFFIQRYFGMTNAFSTCSDIFDGPDTSCLDQRVNGRGFGLEVMLKRSFSKRIGGWISYTLSRSTVTVPRPLPNEPSEVPSNFDRTHVFNSAFSFDFGLGWHAGLRFTYYTGLPYTQTVSGLPIPPFNAYRLPDFWRLDVRLEKRWRVGRRTQVALFLEGMNITFNKEAIGIDCRLSTFGSAPDCKPQMIGPVSVPSLGLDVKY